MANYDTNRLKLDILQLTCERKPEGKKEATANSLMARNLGLFLSRRMHNLGKDLEQFATEADIEKDMVEAILEGWLPAPEISDGLLIDLAQCADINPNVLRIILGRQPLPLPENNPAKKLRLYAIQQ